MLDSSENPRIRLGSTWRREFTRLCLLIPLSCPSTAHTEQNKTRVLTRMETSVCGESHKSKMLCFKYDLNGVHGWSCNPQCVDLSGSQVHNSNPDVTPHSSTLSSLPSPRVFCSPCRITRRRQLKWNVEIFTIVGTEPLLTKTATSGSWAGVMTSSMLLGR